MSQSNVLDSLKIIDGHFIDEGHRFLVRGIAGHAVYERYNADGLRSLSRLVGGDRLHLTIDGDRTITLELEDANRYAYELAMIADVLDAEDTL